jgi:hypothetical protein
LQAVGSHKVFVEQISDFSLEVFSKEARVTQTLSQGEKSLLSRF